MIAGVLSIMLLAVSSTNANAYWRHGYGGYYRPHVAVRVGVPVVRVCPPAVGVYAPPVAAYVPPVVVAPAPAYYGYGPRYYHAPVYYGRGYYRGGGRHWR